MELRSNQFFLAPARLLRGNTRNNSRPNKNVGQSAAPCMAFIRERRFCQLEEEITMEVQRRRLDWEQMKMEARAAGLHLTASPQT